MGALVLGVAGAAVGSLFGPIGASIGFAIGSAAYNLLNPQTITGPKLSDLKLQNSSYGQPIPRVYGSMRIAGNVVWQTDLVPHTKTSGGKGGPKVKTTTYTASFAIQLCEGPISGVRKIWVNGSLKWDRTNTGDFPFTLYLGDEYQGPDPTMEAELGVGNTPGYRGTALIVFKDFDLSNYGNTIPLFTFEVYPNPEEGPIEQVFELDQDPPWGPALAIGWETNWAIEPVEEGPSVAQQMEVHYLEYAGGTRSAYYVPIGGHVLEDGTIINLEILQGYAVAETNILPALTDTSVTVVGTGSESHVVGPSWGSAFGLPAEYVHGACISRNGKFLYVFTSGESIPGDLTMHWHKIVNGARVEHGDVLDGIYRDTPIGMPIPAGAWSVGPGNFVAGMCEDDGKHIWLYVTNAQYITIAPQGSILIWMQDGNDLVFDSVGGVGRPIHTPDSGALTVTEPGYAGTIGGPQTALWTRYLPVTETTTLGQIVADLSERAGLASAEYDVSELDDVVDGYLIASQMAMRSAIEPLQTAYFFDAVEEDGVVKFRKLGREAVATIEDDDLAAHDENSETPALVEIERTPEHELPKTVSVVFINPDLDYQYGTQIAQRMTGASEVAVTVNLPIAMSDRHAKQIADSLLFNAYYERQKYSATLSRKWAFLSPTDPIVVHGQRLRITSKTETPAGLQTLQLVPTRAMTFVQAGLSGTSSTPGQGVDKSQLTTLALLDIPYIADPDRQRVYWAAMAGADRPSWAGASLQKSSDGGTNYAEIATANLPDVMGRATTVLAEFLGGNMFDELNSVTIEIDVGSGDLASVTATQVYNGENEAALGSEIIQFRDATLIDDKTYTLTGLLRGRRGTEWAMNTHRTGERFVVLPTASEIEAKSYDHGVSRTYKAVTSGKTLASATAVTFRNCDTPLLPYAPVQLGAGDDGAGGYILTWRRRARVNNGWQGFIDVPLDETVEAYEVYFWSDATYATKVATYSASTTQFAATAAVLVAVYGSPPPTPYWTVAQIGRIGPGYDSLGRAPVVVESEEQPPSVPSEPVNPSTGIDGGWHDDFRFENGGGALTNAMKNANWLMVNHGSSWSFAYVYASHAGLTAALQAEFLAQYGSAAGANEILNTMAGYAGYAPAGWLRPWGATVIGTGSTPWVTTPNSPPALRAYAGSLGDGPTIIPLPYMDDTNT